MEPNLDDEALARKLQEECLREVQDAELAKRLQEEADMEQQFEVATQMVHDQLASKVGPQ
ncbi:hypothetical protein HaLaN_13558, partial [Haematococcus lacustris]